MVLVLLRMVAEDSCWGTLRRWGWMIAEEGCWFGPLFVIRCKVYLFLFGEWGVVVLFRLSWEIFLLFVLLQGKCHSWANKKRVTPPIGSLCQNNEHTSKIGTPRTQSFWWQWFPSGCGQVAVKDCTCHSSGFRFCILGAKNPTHLQSRHHLSCLDQTHAYKNSFQLTLTKGHLFMILRSVVGKQDLRHHKIP